MYAEEAEGLAMFEAQQPPQTFDFAAYLDDACRVMHDAYEKAAIKAGWETQPRSRVLWDDVPEANKETMRAAVVALWKWQGNPALTG